MKKTAILTLSLAVVTMANAQSFTDGFENAVYSGIPVGANPPPTGNVPGDTVTSVIVWSAINNSLPLGTTGWFDGNVSVFPANGGAKYVAANFNNTTGTNTVDNWLISDNRTFHNGDTISFFSRTSTTPTFPDRLFLKFSSAGASLALSDFSTTLISINPNLTTTGYPNAWTLFTTTLSGLSGAGVSGRFAFNYNVTGGGPGGANSDYIGIDDVSYTVAAVPEPASMVALSLGALAFLRKRRKA